MAALRNMICDPKSEVVTSLMALMETQSEQTLGEWNLSIIRDEYLPKLKKRHLESAWVEIGLEKARAYLSKEIPQKEWKAYFKEVERKHQLVSGQPELALMRAVVNAFRSLHSPTSGLGQLFYGAAAFAYDALGLKESKEAYDAYGEQFLEKQKVKLEKISIADEKNPVKINWYC